MSAGVVYEVTACDPVVTLDGQWRGLSRWVCRPSQFFHFVHRNQILPQ